MLRAKNKVVIVTGGASGLGEADARLLVAEGASVVITDVAQEQGAALAQSLGDNALFLEHDVRDEQGWVNVMERTEAAYGRLDGLVNNAGVSEIETVEETSLESWQFVNDVNSRGTFLGCKHAIPIMKKSGGGSIINISSMAALACYPQYFSYVASKAAVHAMTKSIAVHCLKSANNIRCNSVYPGAINTPLQRAVQVVQDDVEESALSKNNLPVGEPDDIAKLVLYLISDDSRFMNGAELRIDGGGLYL